MKKTILIFFLSFSNFIFSQDNDFYESLGAKQVAINKQYIAYVMVANNLVNGEKIDEKTYGTNLKNPTRITIETDKDYSFIKLNTKGIVEEKEFRFGKIYKMETSEYYYYEFVKSILCSATLAIPKGKVYGNGDQGITIKCIDSNQTGTQIDFSINKEL